jgi:ergothioneine biosynthesis protein EgtB
VARRRPHWLAFAGGQVEIGHAGSGFAFDNEAPRHPQWLAPFLLASHPVTHGEFMAFIDDGGYVRPELWLALGFDVAVVQRWTAPLDWVAVDGDTPMTHLSYFEADAYARWAGARLPTEAEWETAAAGVALAGNFQESGAYHPLALRREPVAGPAQLFGDNWEWTQSAYSPYPGFATAAGAVGEYNGKFMCNQYVLRGGSCATPASHIRASYRNFFPPEARWQFSGLRLARDQR